MAIRICVLCDLHLPARRDTPHWTILDWLERAIARDKPDCALVLGDMTGMGEPEAARAVDDMLSRLPCPVLAIPGNSDQRSGGLDETQYRSLDRQRFTVGGVTFAAEMCEGPWVCVRHEPPDEARLRALPHPPLAALAGHKHCDRDGYVFECRALDPDKAIGGPASVSRFEVSEDGVRRLEPLEWSGESGFTKAQADRFSDLLGISLFDPLAQFPALSAHQVRHAEIRFAACKIPRDALLNAVGAWRVGGGETLSLHLSAMKLDEKGAVFADWDDALALARAASAQYLTLHPPAVPASIFEARAADFADYAARRLEGFAVLLENVHTDFRYPQYHVALNGMDRWIDYADFKLETHRPYGCTPPEMLRWLELMCARLPETRLRLDIGHMRCNAPYTHPYPVSAWYALCGRAAGGFHLHQVRGSQDGIDTHLPFDEPHGKLISLESFLWGWRTGQINEAPMLLETQDFAGALSNVRMLRDYVRTLTARDEPE